MILRLDCIGNAGHATGVYFHWKFGSCYWFSLLLEAVVKLMGLLGLVIIGSGGQ